MVNKTKIIKARVTEDEKCLIKAKAKSYGYKDLSKYLIDASIYEKVTFTDIKNQKLIYDSYASNTKELKKILKDIRHIIKYNTQIDDMAVQNIKLMLVNIMRNQKNMLKLIDKKLDLDVWQEVNRKKVQEE
ncbi:MAG: hypothetical protein HFJ29_03275 [Clostridia bacterium]|nr:hypothetical protein [Clostridia bacterium]